MSDYLRMLGELDDTFDSLLKEKSASVTKTLPYGGQEHRYAVLSDFHLGNGSGADNFRQNETLMTVVLDYYRNEKYQLILLGDIEEFHQFSMDKIIRKYNKSVYDKLRSFPETDVHRVIGNHDIDWALVEPIFSIKRDVAVEAIRLEKKGRGRADLFLAHGHQAEESYERNLHTVRFGTAFFRAVEKIFQISSPSMLSEVPGKKDRIYDYWAAKQQVITICGHTHCPVFADRFIDLGWIRSRIEFLDGEIAAAADPLELKRLKNRRTWLLRKKRNIEARSRASNGAWQPPDHARSGFSKYYYNSGGCLYTDGITNIEIAEDDLRLVYWFNRDNQREVLWKDKISRILN